MTICPRESEVVAATVSGRLDGSWLHAESWSGPPRNTRVRGASTEGRDDLCDELKRHLAQCEPCRDVLFVSCLLQEDRGNLDSRVPGGALVWWRAAVRSKIETERRISRPLTWAYGLTSAVVAGLGVSAANAAWPAVERTSTMVAESMAASYGLLGGAELIETVPPGIAALAIGTLALLVLVPVAACMALGGRR